jgi:hypothetical protein
MPNIQEIIKQFLGGAQQGLPALAGSPAPGEGPGLGQELDFLQQPEGSEALGGSIHPALKQLPGMGGSGGIGDIMHPALKQLLGGAGGAPPAVPPSLGPPSAGGLGGGPPGAPPPGLGGPPGLPPQGPRPPGIGGLQGTDPKRRAILEFLQSAPGVLQGL